MMIVCFSAIWFVSQIRQSYVAADQVLTLSITPVIQPAPIAYTNSDRRSPPGNGLGKNRNCYRPPASTAYNISDNSYFYPKNAIYEELQSRLDVLERIYQDGRQLIDEDSLYIPQESDKLSSVGDGVKMTESGGCASYKVLLRGFDYNGGHCWVVYPRHQAITYVYCGYSSCKGHNRDTAVSKCAVEECTQGVWAWCDNLPLGKRVIKIELPLPVNCCCQIYDC